MELSLAHALAVTGFVLAGEGKKKLTKARKYESDANTKITEIEEAQDLLKQIKNRAIELKNLLEDLNIRAAIDLNELEYQPFNIDRDADKFQQVTLLMKAMSEIMKNPILDSVGNLNPATKNLREKYRYLSRSMNMGTR